MGQFIPPTSGMTGSCSPVTYREFYTEAICMALQLVALSTNPDDDPGTIPDGDTSSMGCCQAASAAASERSP